MAASTPAAASPTWMRRRWHLSNPIGRWCQRRLVSRLRYAMLPAPASIAAPPRPKSRASCNPAVPPPPAAGATVGIWLVDDSVAGAVAVLVTVAVAVAVAVAVGEEVTPGVPEALVPEEGVLVPEEGVLPLEAGAVAEPVAVPEVVTDGVNVGTVGVEEDPLQAETATGARRVRAPQHRAVSLTRSAVPAVVVRTFMGPPHAPGR